MKKLSLKNIFYETICKSVAWIDNNIFDQINILLSSLSYRFGLNSLKLQDGQIHSYGLIMILSGIVSVLLLILLG